jgi:predicted nucleic acid-binding protein
MEWLTQLQDQIVGLDTAPLIYFVEENPDYTALVDPFFEALDRREFRVVSSVITLTEVLVYPMRAGNISLVQQYRDILLDQENVTTVSVSPQIAELAAQIRATYNLRTPDAIQLATAIEEGATFFLTNDDRLLQVQDLQVLVLNQIRN